MTDEPTEEERAHVRELVVQILAELAEVSVLKAAAVSRSYLKPRKHAVVSPEQLEALYQRAGVKGPQRDA